MNRIIGSLLPRGKAFVNLPLEIKTGKSIGVFDVLKDDNIDKAYEVVRLAASRGNNVGKDEFPTTEHFNEMLATSRAFTIDSRSTKNQHKSRMEAVFTISPSAFPRGLDKCISELHVFLPWATNEGAILSRLIPICEKLVVESGLGYTGCIIQVAAPCADWLTQLKSLNYVATANIPQSVNLTGYGLVDSVVHYKELVPGERQPYSTEELMSLPLLKHSSISDDQYASQEILSIPFLPIDFAVIDGIKYRARTMNKNEDRAIYKMFRSSAERGTGYAISEIFTLEYFRFLYLCNNYTVVIEDTSSKQVVGAAIFRKCGFLRNTQHAVYGNGIVFDLQYQRMGLNSAFHPIFLQCLQGLGAQAHLSTTTVNNEAFLSVVRKLGITTVGTIPKGRYMMGKGWCDLFLLHTKGGF